MSFSPEKLSSMATSQESDDAKEEGKVEHPRAQEMQDFFMRHEDLFKHFSRDGSVQFLPGSKAPVPVPTAGVDLEGGKMYFGEEFFNKIETDEKRIFTLLHEGGHVQRLKELFDTIDGPAIARRWMERMRASRRYGLLDNCIADVGVNGSVVDYAPVFADTEQDLYHSDLFPIKDGSDALDMTHAPKHIQFAQAILYEKRVTGSTAIVADDVRAKIDELKNKKSKGVSLLDYVTAHTTPEAMRIRLQEKFLYPIMDELFDQDVNEKENQQKSKEQSEGAQKNSEDGDNSEEYFKEYYDALEGAQPHILDEEELKKEIENYLEAHGSKSPEEMADTAYAKAQGVSTEDLKTYRHFWRDVEQITNPETSERVIEELREMFARIINNRKKKKYVPKYPTTEGEILAFPAEAVVAVKSGEREPKVWETVEQQDRPREMYGDFDVTIVADRSGSMEGEKATEQRKAVALVVEALKDFCDDLDDARVDFAYDLDVRTECWAFGDEAQVEILKPLSSELNEKQRVHIHKTLATTPGSATYDFSALEKISAGITPEDEKKLVEGIMKKIIIVMSDGGTSSDTQLKKVLGELREKNVTIAGVGITASGAPVETAYAPDGQVCKDVGDLARVLTDILKEHLEDL